MKPCWSGNPRFFALVRDGVLSARAQPVATTTAAAVVAVVCLVVLLTTGQSAAAEREVVASIDSVGTRLITVTDTTGKAGMTPSEVQEIGRLNGVTWAFGLGPASDAHNSVLQQAGTGVAMRALIGPLPAEVAILAGRQASAPGEGYAGLDASAGLHLTDVVGSVSDGRIIVGIVGQLDAVGPLAFLDALVLRVPRSDEEPPVRYVYILVDDATHARDTALSVSALLPPTGVKVQTSDAAIALRDVVAGRLGAASRRLMAGVLGCGLVLVSVTMLGAVAARRRDFGRRRALGATRSAIVTLVLIQSAISGVIGAIVGVGATVVGTAVAGTPRPSWEFILGVGLLSLLVTLVGSVPPAIGAAAQDPVRILRVP